LNPLVAGYLLIAILLLLLRPREKAITPFLFAFFTIPIGEVVVLGGFHFTALRVLILAGLARRACFKKTPTLGKYPGGFNRIDWVVVLWSVTAVIAMCLLFREKQAIINGLGVLLDTLGGYLVVRSLIIDGKAMQRTVITLAVICGILGIEMVSEQITHINAFLLLEGFREVTIREGHVRSGATLGCLYAGAFAGVLIPLFLWLWTEKISRVAAVVGLVGATTMVFTSYSSTSWLALMGSFVGLAFWPLRKKMRMIRFGLVATLTGLHLVMKAPVWALIGRIDLTGSSSNFQRFFLVDMTIRHFTTWWLIGTQEYPNWGWDAWDLCNQFVAVALTGGLFTLIFYIAIFSRSFGAIGDARKLVNGDRKREWLLWCFGSTLFATVVAHFGINYMAQLIMGFFPLVACISVVTFEAKKIAVPAKSAQPTTPIRPTLMGVPAAASTPAAHGATPIHQGLFAREGRRLKPGFRI
jgi:hypothetical protein